MMQRNTWLPDSKHEFGLSYSVALWFDRNILSNLCASMKHILLIRNIVSILFGVRRTNSVTPCSQFALRYLLALCSPSCTHLWISLCWKPSCASSITLSLSLFRSIPFAARKRSALTPSCPLARTTNSRAAPFHRDEPMQWRTVTRTVYPQMPPGPLKPSRGGGEIHAEKTRRVHPFQAAPGRGGLHPEAAGGTVESNSSDSPTWLWLKIQDPGLRRCSSTFPFTSLPFWAPIFEPQPHE